MTNSEAIYHHGRLSLATCLGMIVTGLLGVAISSAFFAVTFCFSLMTGWHLGEVAYRSFRT